MNGNYFIPTIVVDDFFEDPDSVRKFALSLEYPENQNNYPGVRTESLHNIDYEFTKNVINKAMAAFFDPKLEKGYYWEMGLHFQKIDQKFVDGWVHKDPAKMTIIIYLNKDAHANAGTSIYRAKDNAKLINDDWKEKFLTGEISYEQAKPYMDANNNQFEEVMNIKNSYNRMIMFDSNRWHAANSYLTESNDPRLTLIGFVYDLRVNEYPIYRMKKQQGK